MKRGCISNIDTDLYASYSMIKLKRETQVTLSMNSLFCDKSERDNFVALSQNENIFLLFIICLKGNKITDYTPHAFSDKLQMITGFQIRT